MADQSKIHSLALQDILLSIADSLNQAQLHLNNVQPYDQFGRPNTTYHLPYLDFTLKVYSEFNETIEPVSDAAAAIPSGTNTGSGTSTTGTTIGSIKPNIAGRVASQGLAIKAPLGTPLTKSALLKFTPVTAGNKSQDNSTQIESTISGRFVAVVPNEGQAQILITCSNTTPVLASGSNPPYEFFIKAKVSNALNEQIANVRVEFNFDEVESEMMNGATISERPIFSISEGLTNSLGEITTKVSVKSVDYLAKKIFFFTINTSNIFQHLSISKMDA